MSNISLEERVKQLETKVAQLEKSDQETPSWWQKRLGAFKDDPEYDEAMRLGEEYRRSQPTPADHVHP